MGFELAGTCPLSCCGVTAKAKEAVSNVQAAMLRNRFRMGIKPPFLFHFWFSKMWGTLQSGGSLTD